MIQHSGFTFSLLLLLLLMVTACNKSPDKKEVPAITQAVHDTVYLYRSDAAAAPYIDDFERIHIDSIDARRKVTKLKHGTETRLLGDVDTAIIVKADRLSIRLYTRYAGDLEIEETHGVYKNVMISVSEYGEYETNQVFVVGPFLGAKFKNKGKDFGDQYEVEVRHGYSGEKTAKLSIYLDKVIIL
ncbi:hypothetical protein [Daejeonella sp.]|uniref:hypothetical protein n=1 Tax=Daejeonella sp. TaxID=2805397 RepID=UPI0030C0916B